MYSFACNAVKAKRAEEEQSKFRCLQQGSVSGKRSA